MIDCVLDLILFVTCREVLDGVEKILQQAAGRFEGGYGRRHVFWCAKAIKTLKQRAGRREKGLRCALVAENPGCWRIGKCGEQKKLHSNQRRHKPWL